MPFLLYYNLHLSYNQKIGFQEICHIQYRPQAHPDLTKASQLSPNTRQLKTNSPNEDRKQRTVSLWSLDLEEAEFNIDKYYSNRSQDSRSRQSNDYLLLRRSFFEGQLSLFPFFASSKMVPNLMPIASKMCNPLSWFHSLQNEQRQHHYHYQMAPVPGIYWCNGPSNRYLVAIKPNDNKDVDNLFATPKTNNISLARPSRQFPRSEPQASSTITLGSATTATNSTKSVSITAENWEGITFSIRTNHDKKPLSKKNHFREFKKEKANFHHITREDCFGGYRRLAEPLKIQYNKILERWMFEAEIEERTIRINMCSSENCESYRHKFCEWQCSKSCGYLKCGTLIEREMFALDDTETWVITGDLKSRMFSRSRRGRMVERADVNLRSCGLFCLTEWEGLRRMRADEADKKREELLKMARGPPRRVAEGSPLYAKVVKFGAGKPSCGTALAPKMDHRPDEYVRSDEDVGLEKRL